MAMDSPKAVHEYIKSLDEWIFLRPPQTKERQMVKLHELALPRIGREMATLEKLLEDFITHPDVLLPVVDMLKNVLDLSMVHRRMEYLSDARRVVTVLERFLEDYSLSLACWRLLSRDHIACQRLSRLGDDEVRRLEAMIYRAFELYSSSANESAGVVKEVGRLAANWAVGVSDEVPLFRDVDRFRQHLYHALTAPITVREWATSSIASFRRCAPSVYPREVWVTPMLGTLIETANRETGVPTIAWRVRIVEGILLHLCGWNKTRLARDKSIVRVHPTTTAFAQARATTRTAGGAELAISLLLDCSTIADSVSFQYVRPMAQVLRALFDLDDEEELAWPGTTEDMYEMREDWWSMWQGPTITQEE